MSCGLDKQKLLIIQGAGCSIPFEMPLVQDVDREMIIWSKEFEAKQPSKINTNFFQEIWDASERYYKEGTYHHGIYPNFESVLGNMIALANWITPPERLDGLISTFGDPIIEELIGPTPFGTLGGLLGLPNDTRKAVRDIIMAQHGYLVNKLADYFRKKCLDRTKPIDSYKKFLEEIRKDFDVGIYNLNYDDVAIHAWPEAYTGFDSNGLDENIFCPKAIFDRKEWGFVYHLHGSVHNHIQTDKQGKTDKQRIGWKKDLSSSNFTVYDKNHMSLVVNSNSSRMPMSTLLAGGFKLEQLSPEPFQTFHSSLVRHAYEANAILIIGYGFGDTHVNWVLKNRYRYDKTKLKVLTVNKTKSEKLEVGYWMQCWRHTFADFDSFSSLEGGNPDIFYPLKGKKNKRINDKNGIYLKGTEKAFESDGIIKFLSEKY